MANDPFIANPVFNTPDGTPASAPAAWTVQYDVNGHQTHPVTAGSDVFATPDKIRTPVNVPGWTVQDAGRGSDQKTVHP